MGGARLLAGFRFARTNENPTFSYRFKKNDIIDRARTIRGIGPSRKDSVRLPFRGRRIRKVEAPFVYISISADPKKQIVIVQLIVFGAIEICRLPVGECERQCVRENLRFSPCSDFRKEPPKFVGYRVSSARSYVPYLAR